MSRATQAVCVASLLEDGALEHWDLTLEGSGAPAGPEHWPGRIAIELLLHPPDEAISGSLDFLGRWSGADSGGVIEYSSDLTQFRSTRHHWWREGGPRPLLMAQNAPVTVIGPLQAELLADRPILMNDIARMPASMRSLREQYLQRGLRSALAVPVFHEDRLRAALGLSWRRPRKDWDSALVAAVTTVAKLIGCVRYGRQGSPADVDTSSPDRVYLCTRRGGLAIAAADLLVLKAVGGDQTEIKTTDGSSLLDLRNLKWWASVLAPSEFMRVHRSALVRIDRIAELRRRRSGGWQVHLDGCPEAVPVSRAALPALRSRLGV